MNFRNARKRTQHTDTPLTYIHFPNANYFLEKNVGKKIQPKHFKCTESSLEFATAFMQCRKMKSDEERKKITEIRYTEN